MSLQINTQFEPSPGKQTILVVHSDATIVRKCSRLLEEVGFSVIHASSGLDGLETIYHQLPDLILSNIVLEDINGYQLCRLIKNDTVLQKIPFVLISDMDEKIDRFWGFKAGTDGYIQQGDLDGQLVEHVSMLIGMYEGVQPAEKRQLQQQLSETEHPDPINVKTRLNQILDKALIESTLMIEIRNLYDLAYDKNLLNHMLFSLLESLLEYDLAIIFYNDRTQETREVTFHIPHGQVYSKVQLHTLKGAFFKKVLTHHPQVPNPVLFDTPEMDVIGTANDTEPMVTFESCYHRDFVSGDGLMGAIAFYSKNPVNYEQIFPVELIEEETHLLMKLRNLYSKAEVMAITDPLTHVYNYRHFISTVEQEVNRSKRYDLELSLALIDIDKLRELNSQWGHLLGDEVLRKVAEQARQSFRSVDFIARFSGGRFVVVFAETGIDPAKQACERFREKVEEIDIQWNEMKIPLTVSVGLTMLTEDIQHHNELIEMAIEALMQAWAEGHNCVELARNAQAIS